jgi:transcriptional regulator of acetoin/glycerol metabolism
MRRLPWRGNIRELRTVLTRLTLIDAAGVIDALMLSGLAGRPIDPPAQNVLRSMLRERIRAVFQETAGNVSETARRLNVSRNTIYRALPMPRVDS